MTRDLRPVIAEIMEALDGIAKATAGKTIEDFRREWLLKHGVQRGLEIISEAARHLPDASLVDAEHIEWRRIRGLGNVLRHEYHNVSDAIVWEVVTNHLPALREAIDKIAVSVPPPADQ